MSAHKTAVVECDEPGCPAVVRAVNVARARYDAYGLGWLCRGGTDLCPKHRPQTRQARIALPAGDSTGREGS